MEDIMAKFEANEKMLLDLFQCLRFVVERLNYITKTENNEINELETEKTQGTAPVTSEKTVIGFQINKNIS